MIARIVLILLSLAAAGLYLRVLIPSQPHSETQETAQQPHSAPPATAPAEESTAQTTGQATGGATAPQAEKPRPALKPLPEDQMQLVLQALAPEMLENQQ